MLISKFFPEVSLVVIANIIVIIFLNLRVMRVRFGFWQFKLPLAVLVWLLVMYVPIYKYCTLSQILYGVVGDLSITSVMLSSYFFIKSLGRTNTRCRLNVYFALIIVILGLLLYLSTLDFMHVDLYRTGYFPKVVVLLLIGLLLLFLFDHAKLYAWVWLIALLGFYLHLQPSVNMWDYLLDPILWLLSIYSFMPVKKISR